MTLLGLLVMLMPLVALGQSENCPEGFDDKSDPPTDITEEWGTATLVDADEDGEFEAVEFFVMDGYTVDVCVKGGNEGFTLDTIVGEDTEVVSTPTGQEVSHYEWTFTFTPPTFDLELKLVKEWAGDDFDDSNLEVTLLIDGQEGPVEVEHGETVAISESVTGLPEICEYDSDAPESFTVDEADAVDGVITLTITNTVDCEDDVLGGGVTTSTTAPTAPTTAPAVQVPTTIAAEVLDTDVEADELPFTGIDSDQLVGMAVLLLAGGLALLGVTGKREDA